MNYQTDEHIAELVQQGDVGLFATLIERYEQKMMRYVRRFLFTTEDAEDIVQDVFLKAFTNLQQFDTDRSFSSWLYRIAHNECINQIRKKEKMAFPFFDPDTLFPHPIAKEQSDRTTLDQDAKNILDTLLGKLKPQYREVVVLYYFEEFDYKTISDILQIPVSTVGVRLARAKTQLKKFALDDKIVI